MTNQLKLKKPLKRCDFPIAHGKTRILFNFYDYQVSFQRNYKGKYEGSCVYRYETPEKGEEFIKEMYRQVVVEEKDYLHLSKTGKFIFGIHGDGDIGKPDTSSIYYSPIPRQEFFRQLRERLKEIVEVVEPLDHIHKQVDLLYAVRIAVKNVLGKGYKITIERE